MFNYEIGERVWFYDKQQNKRVGNVVTQNLSGQRFVGDLPKISYNILSDNVIFYEVFEYDIYDYEKTNPLSKQKFTPYKSFSFYSPQFQTDETVMFFFGGKMKEGIVTNWEWDFVFDGYIYKISYIEDLGFSKVKASANKISEKNIYKVQHEPHNFGIENTITNGGFSLDCTNWSETAFVSQQALQGTYLRLVDQLFWYGENKGENKKMKIVPRKVFFNDKKKVTTLMFGDEPTVVKCGKGDTYSKRVGFLEAYFQAQCGMSKTQAKKYLDKIIEESENK